MKFFRRTAGYTIMDHKKNEVMQEPHMIPILGRKNTRKIGYSMFPSQNSKISS
jgi:hypothetical protein